MLWKTQGREVAGRWRLCLKLVRAKALGFVESFCTAFECLFHLFKKKIQKRRHRDPLCLICKEREQYSILICKSVVKHRTNKRNAALTLFRSHCNVECLYCLRFSFDRSPSTGQKPRCHRGGHVVAPPTVEHFCLSNCANFR